MQGLERELRRAVRGEVRLDAGGRALYATDASIYRIPPLGVVAPLDAADLEAAIGIAVAHGVPLLPRGAGTSLAGQTVGRALVLDCSRHLHHILALDPERRRARVEPGVVLADLNRAALVHGLEFGPDVATADRACLGGMIGNNSSGAHSIVHGMTVDHVEAVRVVLAGGATLELGGPERDRGAGGGAAALRRALGALVERYREAIARDYPPLMRRVMGYNLDRLAPAPAAANLASLIVGSEGTLATVVEATVRLVPRAHHRALAVLHHPGVVAAAEQVPAMLRCRPAAVELLDGRIVELARGAPAYAARTRFVRGAPGALLLVEVTGDNQAALAERLAAVRAAAGPAPLVELRAPAAQADVWAVRKAGLAILGRLEGAAKPVGFVEDTAVDPARLADYLRRFQAILERHGTGGVYYGHASVGCIHIRPILDLQTSAGVETLRAVAGEVAALVREFGGALSGEHGDGLLRSPWITEMLGPELARAFGEVKALFDPRGLMNPGKIVAPGRFTDHLRFEADGRPSEPVTELDFSAGGGYREALARCNGNGRCRKLEEGAMCPSFMATRDEEHSPRGRTHLLEALIDGRLAPGRPGERQVAAALDLCLGCKACLRECPTSVDVSRLKVEFLARRQARRGPALADRLFGGVRGGLALACRWPGAAAWLGRQPLARALLEQLAGIDRRRSLPRLAPVTLRAGWTRAGATAAANAATVVLLDDTFTGHLEPGIGEAAARVLEAAGERVKLPDRPVCCGRPLISRGLLPAARRELRRLLDVLEPDLAAGRPVIGLEPSCLLTFRDEVAALLPDDPRVALLRDASFLLDEYMRSRMQRVVWKEDPVDVLVHAHCHRQALAGPESLRAVLSALPGVSATLLDAGCCGMAGSWGYERRHHALSLAIGERVLLPAVRAASAATLVVAEGTSCRHQLLDGAGRASLHPAELLAARLAGEAGDAG